MQTEPYALINLETLVVDSRVMLPLYIERCAHIPPIDRAISKDAHLHGQNQIPHAFLSFTVASKHRILW